MQPNYEILFNTNIFYTMEKQSIYSKISACKDAIGSVQRSSTNPFLSTKDKQVKYAPLSEILKAANKAMHENKLYLEVQAVLNPDHITHYRFTATFICTESSEKVTTVFDVPFDTTQKNPVQGFGAMFTYAQRYIYGVLFGIPFDDTDPDAQTNGVNAQQNTVSYSKAKAKMSEEKFEAAMQSTDTVKLMQALTAFNLSPAQRDGINNRISQLQNQQAK